MIRTIAIAPVRKSIRVGTGQAHAFDVFTSGIGRWWPRKATVGKPPRRSIAPARAAPRALLDDGVGAGATIMNIFDF